MDKETYNKLKAKLKLPEFSELDHEFEISSIDEEGFPLRHIRRKMVDKIEVYSAILGDIIQPNAESITNLRECRIFGDDEKGRIYEMFKKLISFKRLSHEADLILDDKKDAEFIIDAFKRWKELKAELVIIIQATIECWKKETSEEERLEYLG
jgi:hypothetical protein